MAAPDYAAITNKKNDYSWQMRVTAAIADLALNEKSNTPYGKLFLEQGDGAAGPLMWAVVFATGGTATDDELRATVLAVWPTGPV